MIVKCLESIWKFPYYAAVEFVVLRSTYQNHGSQTLRSTLEADLIKLKLPIKLIYMAQCGFYLYNTAALLTWETRRKDFVVMMSHHIVIVILISCSYITRFFRIGIVVLPLHDASDVFMEAAKVFKYSEREFGANLFFGLFALTWFMLMLMYFPFWVIRASSYHLIEFLDLSETYNMVSKLHLQHDAIDILCFSHLLVDPHMLHDHQTVEK